MTRKPIVIMAAAAALVVMSLPTAADPIFSPLILTALGGAGGIFGGATAVIASIVSAILVTAVTRGVEVL